jgi:hypothetical protein
MSHTGQQCFRRIGEWECLTLDSKVGGTFYLTNSKSIPVSFEEKELEVYPTHVIAKSDFAGGQRFEIFEIRDPLNARMGQELEVWSRQESKVLIPTRLAEPIPDPLWNRQACAV